MALLCLPNNKYAEVYPLWAEALETQGQWDEAWEKIEKAIALNPNDLELKNKQKSLLDQILAPESPLKENETIGIDGVKFNMILVRKGIFTMGATEEQGDDAWDDEKPIHKVMLSDYYIGETVVTQALWKAVMGTTIGQQRDKAKPSWPLWGEGDDYPMYYVSYKEIVNEFLPKLNQMTGKNFRLPTEAEWEYAARGGNKSKRYKYAGSNNIDNVAWYEDNSKEKPHAVKTKLPNELGIYDMSGNVWEWCQDRYGGYGRESQTNPKGASNGSNRVLRGGGWIYIAGYCRVSSRGISNPDYRNPYIGFRLVLPQ